MSTACPIILCIDDEMPFLNSLETIFRGFGFIIEVVDKGIEAIKKLKSKYFNYSFIMTDLEMPEMDGIALYQELRKINPKIPIAFVSAHFGEPTWEKRLSSFQTEPLRIEKPFPVTRSNDFIEMVEMINSKVTSYKKELSIPFNYSLSDFKKLSDEEMEKVFEEAFEINAIFMKYYFEQYPGTDWVVIAKEPGKIVASGGRHDEPVQEDLERLAKKYDAPVFTYSRPKIIEETNPCCWSNKTGTSNPGEDGEDFYPTVAFKFKSGQCLICDFDTGSTASFLSYEELLSKEIIGRQIWNTISYAYWWGKRYKYYKINLDCELIGNNCKGKEIILNCEAVKNWKSSPQIKNYQDRIGLIGRDLLLKTMVKLLLDGEGKKTDVLMGDQNEIL